jgi:hypothetical protein
VTLRYFLYISDAKVDVLLPQVPGVIQQRVSAKLGFDIKILSGSIAHERVTHDSRVASTVESYLLENEAIGTPEDPKSWIQGQVNAQFLDVGEGGILFVAAEPAWLLALGGSATHLVGAAKPERIEIPMSLPFNLIKKIRSLSDKNEPPEERASAERTWAGPILWASDEATGPALRIKFLAKRLASEVCQNRLATLASPLYIEHADGA